VAYDRVVVGIDFTEAGIAAVQHAVSLAGPGTVELVHVVSEEQLPRAPLFSPELVRQAYEKLEAEARGTLEQLAREIQQNGTNAKTQLVAGRPADELVRVAAGADLLVVAAHSRNVLDRIALGSVAEEIVRMSRTPVLVVREKAEGHTKIGRVLVAQDLVDPCPEALEAAVALAARTGAKLEAVHVVQVPVPSGTRFLAGAPEDLEARVRHDAERSLAALLSSTKASHAGLHVAFGAPAAEIAKLARRDDVIVTGTHGRGTFGRLAFGSVATKLLRTAPCPVLVVRPKAKS
jgi:nucleotide-binding universal stress UspA family protein